ncbi:MAG: PilZ domain-containing protein [Candidatus Omnitrophota bacterium]
MPQDYQGQEKRRHKRYKVNLNVLYRSDNPLAVQLRNEENERRATMADMSEGGMSIITNLKIAEGTDLYIRFLLVESEEESGIIDFVGKIRYNKMITSDSYRIGISFEELDKISRIEIHHFLKMLERKRD